MNEHQSVEELLPLYVAKQLSGAERERVERHLLDCQVCRSDLELWGAIGDEIRSSSSAATPPPVIDWALEAIHARSPWQVVLVRAWNLLRAQALLVQRELWPACAAVMVIAVAVALLAERAQVLQFVAPLVAAAGLAALYGPERDPAAELALATPTSAWKILLARLTLVSGYNLLLALVASFALLALVPPEFLSTLVLSWLAPMAFLSALALLLSLWIGTNNAVSLVYGLWLARYVLPSLPGGGGQLSQIWSDFLSCYLQFWSSPALLMVLSAALIGAAMLVVDRSERLFSPRAIQ